MRRSFHLELGRSLRGSLTQAYHQPWVTSMGHGKRHPTSQTSSHYLHLKGQTVHHRRSSRALNFFRSCASVKHTVQILSRADQDGNMKRGLTRSGSNV